MRRRPFRVVAACAVTAAAALLSACSSSTAGAHGSTPTPSPTPSVDPFLAVEPLGCLPSGAQAARLGEHGAHTVVAWSAPTGTRGVLLAPQMGDTACEWSQEWIALRQQGYVVGSFDWGPDDQDSMRLAAQKLRDLGVTQLALVGASKGGTFVAAMARDLDAVAVVALSPPSVFGTGDAVNTGYTGPLLVYASKDDGAVPPSDSRLVARDPATQFHVLPGDAHGVALLQGQYNTDVQKGIDATLAAGFGG
ncbi:alpha/beta hydrolase family protein [Cellulomonas alba]|uniref:Alpha/beta hydrolase n=1 Tax=Cellulomonas alba TaxID=3053467 RepID=A0ABT7SG96_9CELL|nr:hypothetical protein [Cellulomonas alba]MDM7855223.1 hypothetical protein [Cellulomonas alba]